MTHVYVSRFLCSNDVYVNWINKYLGTIILGFFTDNYNEYKIKVLN